MPFSRRASAVVVEPQIDQSRWGEIRKEASVVLETFQNRKAATVIGEYDPSRFLLSHATIVASVDTVTLDAPLGKQLLDGVEIHRKYPDFRITAETEDLINDNCFPPGTMITMGDGTLKSIEEVCVGDEVMTHLGRIRKVLHTMVRDVSENLYSVRAHGKTWPVRATGNHPFFVFRTQTHCASCGLPRKIHSRTAKYMIGSSYCSKACASGKLNVGGEFVSLRDLDRSDFCVRPVLSGYAPSGLTKGKARLIGLFLAEGYYKLYGYNNNERVGVHFAYSKAEIDTLARLTVDLLKREFGVDAVVRSHPSDGGIHVDTQTNRELVRFFETWVPGSGSKGKKLNKDLLRESPEIQMEILRGWFEGDGCLHVNNEIRLTGVSASRSLINQIQIILDRLGISSYVDRRVTPARIRTVEDGVVKVRDDLTRTLTSWALSCGGGWIPSLVKGTYYESAYDSFVRNNGGIQNPSKYRFWQGYHANIVQEVGVEPYVGPVYNFEVEEDHSYIAEGFAVHNCDAFERKLLLNTFRTFVGAESYVEHMQIPALSKGKIIDAVARDIGKSVYVDILVANDLKHKPLIASIQSGELNTLSMGAVVSHTTCSICGNVAEDDAQLCIHIRNFKGSKFKLDDGTERVAAELCGHYTDPTSCKFIEASWVANPAFKGAVLRNILTAPQGTFKDKIDRAHEISAAANSNVTANILNDPSFWGRTAAFKPVSFSFNNPAHNARTPVTTDPSSWVKDRARLPSNSKVAEEDDFNKMVEDIYRAVRDKTVERLKKDLESLGGGESGGGEEPVGQDPSEMNPDDNETLIRQAFKSPKWAAKIREVFATFPKKEDAKRVVAGLVLLNKYRTFQALTSRGFTGKDLLKVSYYLDRHVKKETFSGLNKIYATVSAVGGTSKFTAHTEYLAACESHMGRKATRVEQEYLITRGKILSLSLTLLSIEDYEEYNARSCNLEPTNDFKSGRGATTYRC